MKMLIGVVVTILAACVAVPLLGADILLGGDTSCAPAAAGTGTPTLDAPNRGQLPTVGGFDTEQITNVATILTVGQAKGVPPWGWVVAVATALQESGLRNLPGGDHDSIGLFQQRPSQGWGTAQQLADPTYQAGAFFDTLLHVDGWQLMPLTEAAQHVQRSAYPDAYAKHTDRAVRLVDQVGATLGLPDVGSTLCGGISPQGWIQPVHAAIVSGFRTVGRPGHDGVDLAAPRHTLIVAAASGSVIRERCNAIDTRDGSDWGCSRDGDPTRTKGCGWYVDILHSAGVITRYCHMGSQPLVHVGDPVTAGQPLGEVGSTGHSSGPHLHFEVHLHADEGSNGAIDPVPWMREHAAPIGLG